MSSVRVVKRVSSIAKFRFTGPVVHYRMGKREVKEKGLSLAVSDEYLKSCKVDNVLFRIWFQVTEQSRD